MEDKKIGFLGAGQMAEALARGFVNQGIVKAENIRATDPMAERKEVFRSFGAVAVDTNAAVSSRTLSHPLWRPSVRSPRYPIPCSTSHTLHALVYSRLRMTATFCLSPSSRSMWRWCSRRSPPT